MTRAQREKLVWTLGYVEALVRAMPWISAMGEAQLSLGATIRSGEVGHNLRMAGVSGVVTHEDGQEQLLTAWINAAKQALARETAA
jgi:hypothetical protein